MPRLLALALLAVMPHAAAAQDLTLDTTRVVGKLRSLHGVNNGPLNLQGTLDLSPRFREFAPPLVRLHDTHWPNADVIDMHVVFPDPRADPERPESYDFTLTDEYLASVKAVGAGIVYRLGESIEHRKTKRHVHPPRDPERWAAACVGIIRHYNEGWANGAHHDIRYWEIWNEPDNRPSMWTGTDEEYFRLYSLTAKAIKQRFPNVKVGGPALGNTGNLKGDTLEPTPFLTRFLAHCQKDGDPLDFFSWHVYTNDPTAVVRRAREVRRLLDAAGFRETESHLNEWNYLPDDRWDGALTSEALVRERWHDAVGGPHGAAFAAATLLQLQDASLDAANYFTAEPQGMSLFNCHGVPRPAFDAFKAFRTLVDRPLRLPIAGKLPPGVAIAAGTDEQRHEVTVLVSKFAGEPTTLRLAIPELPWLGETRYEMAVLDERRGLTPVRAGRLDGAIVQELRAPTVCLIRLTKGS